MKTLEIIQDNSNENTFKKQPHGVFHKKGLLKYLATFIGKHPCQCLFFNKVVSLSPATILKIDLGKGVFL